MYDLLINSSYNYNTTRYYKLQDTVSQKKIELQKVTQEKRNMEKALLFKEREIDVRHKENETQSKVRNI